MDRNKEAEKNVKIQHLADHFADILSPLEPTLMKLQSLLVWENPIKSSVMLAVVHCFFWFFTYGGCRLISTLCTFLMIAFFLHTWKKRIWPEIRVPPKSPDNDDWTPVHPRLLSVPELCQHLALLCCYLEQCFTYWATKRANERLKFCVETTFICGSLAVVGHYISGVMLCYVVIISCILWPCLQYHNLLKKVYMKCEPIFMKLDYSIKVKNKWRYEGDRAPVSTNENTDEEGKLATSFCADNESDLEDFYPSDPMISAALARAITDSEDEGTTPSVSITPKLSKEPSVTYSDDEYQPTERDEFGLSIDVMPSFEDTLDHTDDEMLDLPSIPTHADSRESSEESMRFIPSHFSDSEEESTQKRKTRSTRRKPDNPPPTDIDTTNIARDVVARAFSNIMGTMIQQSVLGSLQNMAGQSASQTGSHDSQTRQRETRRPRRVSRDSPDQASSDRFASSYSDSDDETVGTSDQSRRDELIDSNISEDASSLNIEEEFDFLDEYVSSPEKN